MLFLDEPTTGLDPEVRAELWTEIERLAREESMTILLTTHYLEEADRLASDLAIVDRGRVVATGSPDQLKSELRGDSIHVELAETEPNGRVVDALVQVPGLGDPSLEGPLRASKGRPRRGGGADGARGARCGRGSRSRR